MYNKTVIDGDLTAANFIKIAKILPSLRLQTCSVLLNHLLGAEVLKWDADSIGVDGDETVTAFMRRGLAINKVLGVNFFTTIKREIVRDDEIFAFAPSEFIGRFVTLVDANVYVKQEADTIKIQVKKCLGVGIGNVNSVIRCLLGTPIKV